MKKLLLLILIITQGLYLNAQSLTVTGSNSVLTSDPCLQTHSSLTVKNVSNKEHDILCEKNVISQPSGMDNFFCWGGNCYGPSTIISSSHLTLASGQADAVSFGGYFDAYCDLGQATIEYCFYPDGDSTDNTCIYITYHGAAASISETSPISISEFYPNPAKEFVNVNYYLNSESEMVIMDILGSKVKNIYFTEKGTQNINISDLSKGIYFGNLISNNEVVAIKKLIVK